MKKTNLHLIFNKREVSIFWTEAAGEVVFFYMYNGVDMLI